MFKIKKKRWILCGLSLLLLLVLSLHFVLSGSLPHLRGSEILSGLSQSAVVERDHLGIPVIHGHCRMDIARVTGYLHAQDRFFQMDLTRRMAAGELSEIFGTAALTMDKEQRLHGFRPLAKKTFPKLTLYEQELLIAFAEGVNSGLNALSQKPFEYFLLGVNPIPWKPEDSILIGYSLFIDLQDPLGQIDRSRGVLKEYLPQDVYKFLVENGSLWESAIDQSKRPLLPIPSENHFSYLANASKQSVNLDTSRAVGSNQWAVGPSLSQTGQALIANDMHLNHRVPTTWYRLGFDYEDENGHFVQLDGVSLPGTPIVAVGSNRKIAWGFTNSFVDTTDLVLIDIDPTDPTHYLTSEGSLAFEERIEEIHLKGEPSILHRVKWTKWGPLHPELFIGQPVAIRWIAHDFDAFNFKILDLEKTATTTQALKALPGILLPSLNFMVVDTEGHIGWGLVGAIPKREGFSPGVPVSFSDGSKRWANTSGSPLSVSDPENGCLWTANNRIVEEDSLGFDFVNGVRAFQIEKRLKASPKHSVADFVALQLDDEAIFFKRWHSLLLSSLDKNDREHLKLYQLLCNWDGRASAESKEYFCVRSFRQRLMERILGKVLAPCFKAYPQLKVSFLSLEEPVYQLAFQQPSYIADWKKEFESVLDEIIKNDLEVTWGDYNRASICHPLSRFIPFAKYFLDMPNDPQSGDFYVPRATSSTFGASMRMVVTPGHEEEGVLNIPCGQSGHPLSPHYRDQHQAWFTGKPSPFLPGPPVNTLTLTPK